MMMLAIPRDGEPMQGTLRFPTCCQYRPPCHGAQLMGSSQWVPVEQDGKSSCSPGRSATEGQGLVGTTVQCRPAGPVQLLRPVRGIQGRQGHPSIILGIGRARRLSN
jgi:hypothetical protein